MILHYIIRIIVIMKYLLLVAYKNCHKKSQTRQIRCNKIMKKQADVNYDIGV